MKLTAMVRRPVGKDFAMTVNAIRRRLLAAAGMLAMPVARADSNVWSAIQAGGVAILLRHALTEPGVGDPPGYRLNDCATQRNLSAEGREQAARIGRMLGERSVRVDAVLSSRWCRCLDTARLAFPQHAVVPFDALNSFFDDRAAESGRTRAALERIAAIRAPANAAFVTHHVNILALTGEAVGAGEILVVRHTDGKLLVVGRLRL
jgi:phosphohistidine phosphatase SixA